MRWEDDRFTKWEQHWLDRIAADICRLHAHKTIFHAVRALLSHNQQRGLRGDAFREFVEDAYVALIVSDIRRQGTSDPSTLSLARLLGEVSAAPTVLSRARFAARYPDQERGGTAWHVLITAHFAGRGHEHVDPYLVKQDLEALRAEVRAVDAYAAEYFGRRAQSGPQPEESPTHTELDASSDFVFALLQKYYVLFRATALTPPPLSSKWQAIFRDP
jgi:hypothetical protein